LKSKSNLLLFRRQNDLFQMGKWSLLLQPISGFQSSALDLRMAEF
jgi:hypothetical protein